MDAVTVSVMMVPAAVPARTLYTAVIVAVEPGGTLGFVQDTGAKGGHVHVPPPVVTTETETKVVLVGVPSENVDEPQFEGPLLVIVWVYVMVEPAVTGLGVPVLVTARSQATPTFVVTLVLLLAEVGSDVVADTVELAVIELAVTVAGTPRITIMSEDVLAAMLGFVHVIVPVPPTAGVMQVHPAGGEIDWKVVLVGVASVNVAPVAVAGPLFVTVCV